ncbi:MAG: ABC transporter ATP-binding protein [bacterium]|nr:ABC transporter ATP-binding protein [Acidimicrobiia bacterium]MCY4649678.1 ABC transporter ATP-binding protein [bacterium]
MASISFDKVTKRFPGSEVKALSSVSFDIGDGEFVVLVGPSGCGKTTLLRIVAGLESATEGRVLIDGKDISRVPPGDRNIAMVFQNYALFPHLTVEHNIGFGLRIRGVPKAERKRKVREAAELLELDQYLDRRPGELSGGQRQRVAMGRAIVRRPAAFLMDEPLSNLDAKLRVEMRAEISRLQRRLGATMVYVTHDQTEAMTMGDRVAVLDQGLVQQVAPPVELYQNPANVFVGGFIGAPRMNLLRGTCRGGTLRIGDRPVRQKAPNMGDGEVLIGARPEDVELVSPESEAAVLTGRVALVEHLGKETHVHLDIDESLTLPDGGNIVATSAPLAVPQEGAVVGIGIDLHLTHFFAADSGLSMRAH